MKDDEANWRSWRSKTDDEIADAARHLSDYTEKGQRFIREEFHFRGLDDPHSTKRPIDDSRSPVVNRVSSLMNNRIAVGIIILIIGVALIIISPSLSYYEIIGKGLMAQSETNTTFKDAAFILGILALIIGGIIFAVGFSQFMSTQQTTPTVPTTQPVLTQSISPKSVELGNTPDEVQSVMGQPDKIINLGVRIIHVYKDLKIIYVDGKVSDVHLS